jgi:hypothetical protein
MPLRLHRPLAPRALRRLVAFLPIAAPSRGQRRPLLIAAALAVGLLGGAAQAQSQGKPAPTAPEGGGARLSDAQQRKLFPELRALAVQDHQARIGILQQGQRCLGAAGNGDGLRACLRQERQALDDQRGRHREAVHQAYQRLGIPLPPGGQHRRLRPPAPAIGQPQA